VAPDDLTPGIGEGSAGSADQGADLPERHGEL
jgi:hypothetical protein